MFALQTLPRQTFIRLVELPIFLCTGFREAMPALVPLRSLMSSASLSLATAAEDMRKYHVRLATSVL